MFERFFAVMGFVNFFGRLRQQPPARVPTDTVVPLVELGPYYYYAVELLFRFDRVLDAHKLQQSLSQLMEIGNWRQLGGRLSRREVCLFLPTWHNFDSFPSDKLGEEQFRLPI
jgi:hypothetical protein